MTTPEETVDIEWQFFCFRRHIADEALAVWLMFQGNARLMNGLADIINSAQAGVCQLKCIGCARNIFGGQALAGLVFIQSITKVENHYHKLLAPICRDCVEGDRDILESRAMEHMKKNLGATKMEVTL